jgi:hypothetical protein
MVCVAPVSWSVLPCLIVIPSITGPKGFFSQGSSPRLTSADLIASSTWAGGEQNGQGSLNRRFGSSSTSHPSYRYARRWCPERIRDIGPPGRAAETAAPKTVFSAPWDAIFAVAAVPAFWGIAPAGVDVFRHHS